MEEKYGRSKTYHDVERCLVIKSTGTFQSKYSSLPISRSLKGNEKNIEIAGVRHIGGSKKFLIFNVKINKD